MTQLIQGFWYFARSRSRKIHKNTRTKYRKIQLKFNQIHVCTTYLKLISAIYWGYLLAVNLQIYLETSSLKRANNVPKLPGVDYVAKNWALAMMLKALPLVHFWNVLLLKEQMMTVRTTLKTLVWSAQNRSISIEIIPENNHKIGLFYRLIYGKVCPENCHEIGRFFHEFAPKNPWNLTVFPDLSEVLHCSA